MPIRVLIEQCVIPHYRVPFFAQLAKCVDLIVVASEQGTVDGLQQITGPLPFRTIHLPEAVDGPLHHPGLIQVLEEERIDVLVSWSGSFLRMLHNPEVFDQIKSENRKLIWFGCDGFATHSFFKKILRDFAPWRIIQAIRDRRLMRKIDHFIAYSSRTKKFWRIVQQIPQHKISVGQNAIDTSILEKAYAEWSIKAPKTPGRSIIFTGRLTPGKRVDILIQAFARISSRYPDATLTLIGDGSERRTLEELAQNLHLEHKISFLGGIYQDEELAPHLYKASLFVMPGLGGLGFNTAMAMGLPIIFTHADGTEQDLIEEGHQGWFFDGSTQDLSRVLAQALQDPEQLLRMGASAHTRIATTYNLTRMVEAYVAAISQTYYAR